MGRDPGEGNSYPLQYSRLENPMDRGAWWATVHVVAESDMTERLTLSLPVYLEETNFGIQRAYRKNNFKLILRGPHEFEEKRPNCV